MRISIKFIVWLTFAVWCSTNDGIYGQSVSFPGPGTPAASGGTVANPTTSNSGGSCTGSDGAGWTCTASTTVSLADSTAGSTICYTSDSSTPTASAGICTHGTTYSSGFTVSSTTTIKAIGSKSGLTNSSVVTVIYTISAGTLTFIGGCANSHTIAANETGCNYTPTAGNDLLIGVCAFNTAAQATSVALSTGQTQTVPDFGGRDSGTVNNCEFYHFFSVPSGVTQITASGGATWGGAFPSIGVMEFSGGLSAIDATSTTPHTNAAGTWTSNLISPTSGQLEAIVAIVYQANTLSITATSPWTIGNYNNSGGSTSIATVYQIVNSTTGTYTATGTTAFGNTSALGGSYNH